MKTCRVCLEIGSMTSLLIRFTLVIAPLTVFGKVVINDESIDSPPENVEGDTLDSCEGAEGLELALCIVERYSDELKAGQRRHLETVEEFKRKASLAKWSTKKPNISTPKGSVPQPSKSLPTRSPQVPKSDEIDEDDSLSRLRSERNRLEVVS
ncbi:hypothetical protein V3C99_007399 [Haemonchus contortus]